MVYRYLPSYSLCTHIIADIRIVRATGNIQTTPAPTNTFYRGDELSSDNQIHTRLRYLERKISYRRHTEGTAKLRGGYLHRHGIPIFGKKTVSIFRLLFETAKQRYTVHFRPVNGTSNEKKLLRAQQNQEGAKNRVRDVTGGFKFCETRPN